MNQQLSSDQDDIFLGLSTVEQFEAKLNQFQIQTKFQKSLSILYPVPSKNQLLIRKGSMTQSGLSTAINSTQLPSRKQTFYNTNNDIKSPKRRKSILIDEVRELDVFSEKISYLTNKCQSSNDQIKNECLKIASELGISLINLQQLQTIEERENMIISILYRQILEATKSWKSKIDSRELARIKQEEKQPIQQMHYNKQNLDIFDWIEVHTKFRQLKRKLKFALVEIINDKSNSQNLYNQLQNSPNSKISDITYTKPDTRAIIDELTNLLKIIKTKANSNPNPNKSTKSSSQQIELEQWTQEKEQQFVDKRQNAKFRLGKLINSSSWNQIGMGEFVYSYDQGKSNKQQRDQILEKYYNSEQVSEDEILYIVNTSILLNKCSDKKFIQKAINHLDNEIISDVELLIAENILKSYSDVLKSFNKSRHIFLQDRNEIQFQKNRAHMNVQDNKDKQNQLKKLQIKILKMIRQMSASNTLKINSDKYKIYKEEFKKGNPIANPLVWKFKDIMMNLLKQKKMERRNNKLETKKDQPLFTNHKETLTLNMIRRKNHPSSKLVFKLQNDDIKIMPTPQKEIESYKLSIQKKEYEKEKNNFKIFYSGGPIKARPFATSYLNVEEVDEAQELLPCKGQWITPEIEIQAINKIKKAMRAYISRLRLARARSAKKMQRLQEKEQSQGFHLFEAINKLRAKPLLELDIEDNLKKLKIAVARKQGQHKEPKKVITSTLDYSKIKIPKKMIQLKLKQRKLFLALKVGNIQWCEHSGFIFDEYDINCYDIDMYCPLYYAAKLQSVQFCTFLINNGADVNMPCKNNATPVFAAFQSNNVQLINLFIENNADLDWYNDEGKNALCYCSVNLLKELNLQNCPIQTKIKQPINNESGNNKLQNKRSSSMVEVNYQGYVDMHMDPINDPEDDVAWHNQQVASLKTFYPQGRRIELQEKKAQLLIEQMEKRRRQKNNKSEVPNTNYQIEKEVEKLKELQELESI